MIEHAFTAPGRRHFREVGSKTRLLSGAVAGGVAAGVVLAWGAAPVSAQQRPAEPLAGTVIQCGTRTLTFTEGYQVGDLRRVSLGNGDEVVIVDVTIHAAAVVDADGQVFRVVGSANSVAHVPVTSGGLVDGHFNVNLSVVGDGGLLGRIWLRERLLRDGSDVVLSGGGCSF